MALTRKTLTSMFTLLFGFILQWSSTFGCSERERLVRDLTKNYLTSVEPSSAVLKTGLSLLCSRYDKITGELITNAWERYFWTDARLRWEPKDYDGIESLRLPSRLIWTPDFKLYNSLKATEDRDETNAVVTYEGSVIWIPTVAYRTLCSNEPSRNSIACQIIIGSWTYDADILKLELQDQGVDLSSYFNSTCPLTVQKATAVIRTKYYPCCKEPYSSLEVNLNLQSKP